MLVVEGLSVTRASQRVVTDLTFHVDAGEVLALLGREGAGKTSLLDALAGVVRPSAGTVLFREQDIHHWPTWRIARQGLVYVPAGRPVFPSLTVHENLLVPRTGRRGDTDALLAKVYGLFPSLDLRRDLLAWHLSGGEQQMLVIARALMAEPVLLVLDEPNTGLATETSAALSAALRQFAQDGGAVLVAEGGVERALAEADRVLVLEEGHLLAEGPVSMMRPHPALAALEDHPASAVPPVVVDPAPARRGRKAKAAATGETPAAEPVSAAATPAPSVPIAPVAPPPPPSVPDPERPVSHHPRPRRQWRGASHPERQPPAS